jgi:tRNA threonylcarbamoyladenosine biosynthesis protein TsaE
VVHKNYFSKEYRLNNAEKTQAIALALATYWQANTASMTPRIWYLEGDLGAGKTTFSQAFIKTLMQDPELRVKSPTYTLVEQYESLTQSCRVLHADLYRLGEPEELEYLGFRDLEAQADVVLLEWPSKATGFLPPADLLLSLRIVDTGRYLKVVACSPEIAGWLRAWPQ